MLFWKTRRLYWCQIRLVFSGHHQSEARSAVLCLNFTSGCIFSSKYREVLGFSFSEWVCLLSPQEWSFYCLLNAYSCAALCFCTKSVRCCVFSKDKECCVNMRTAETGYYWDITFCFSLLWVCFSMELKSSVNMLLLISDTWHNNTWSLCRCGSLFALRCYCDYQVAELEEELTQLRKQKAQLEKELDTQTTETQNQVEKCWLSYDFGEKCWLSRVSFRIKS